MEPTNTNTEPNESTPTEVSGAFDALSPKPGTTDGGASPEQKRIAELERELQQERVEKGRLKTTSDELRKLKEENERLRTENSNLRSRKPSDYLDENERDLVDDSQLGVIDKLTQGRIKDATAELRSELEAEKSRMREEAQKASVREASLRKSQFDAEVERFAPGITALVSENREDWLKWAARKNRAASIAEAFNSLDAETAADFLCEFVKSKGLQPRGDGIAARPDSSYSPRGGSRPASGARDVNTYTVDQYNAEIRKATADFEAGRITLDERKAIQKKFDNAMAEGRIVSR